MAADALQQEAAELQCLQPLSINHTLGLDCSGLAR